MPKNSVRPKSVAPRIERSTWVSAAKLTIASQAAAALRDGLGVADVADDELDPGALEVRRVAGIGQLVEHAYVVARREEPLGEVGADEAGPACDEHAHREKAT